MMKNLILIVSAVILLTGSTAMAGIDVVYDFAKSADKAKATGASHVKNERSTSAGVEKQTLFIHPTDVEARAEFTVDLPAVPEGGALALVFAGGIRDGVKLDDKDHPFDGVDLAVDVDGKRVWEMKELKEFGWKSASVDLSEYAGKSIKVAFVSNPRANCNYDWSAFAEPRVVALTDGFEPGPFIPAVKGYVLVNRASGFSLTPLNASDAAIGEPLTVRTTGFQVIPFDYNKIKAYGIRVETAMPESVRVFAYDPAFEVTAVGPGKAVIFTGETVNVRAVVKNTGDAPYTRAIPITAQMGDDESTKKKITSLFPGEEATVEWPWTAPKDNGNYKVSVNVGAPGGDNNVSKSSGSFSVYDKPQALPAPTDKAAASALKDGSVVLSNRNVLVQILPQKTVNAGDGNVDLPSALVYSRDGNEWRRVGSIAPLGRFSLAGKSLSSPAVKVTHSTLNGTASVEVSAVSGGRALYLTRLSMGAAGGVKFTTVSELKKGEVLKVLSGPVVLAGDGADGAIRDDGIFAGLEYLLSSDRSSGLDFVHPPYSLRLAPHPNKVTIPVMAVRQGGILTSVEWDPLQKWDGVHDRPAAAFASPNFYSAQDNHMMALFLPSIPNYTPENKLSGKYTAMKDTKLVLSGEIKVRTGAKNVLEAVVPLAKTLAEKPWAPVDKVNFADVQKMCVKSMADVCWDDEKKAWRHTNTGPVYFDSMIALPLWHYSNVTPDVGQRENLRKQINEAVEKASPGQLGLDFACHVGYFERELSQAKSYVQSLIRSQRPDGSWPFTPDEKRSVFGKYGDTSSGWTATSALPILSYARMTGDAEATAAGLKALKYLDTQTRPEGAQTWELQLHVPDILASGRIIADYLEGYQITGDKHYLERASYWAKTGLPFVYLWNAPDRNIMRYGTIPVFGATWFDAQPWFGVMVQWCGLDYAYELQRLAVYDDSMPWMKIAKGITVSAYQQQKYITGEYPKDYGMYPDAYSPVKGKEEYHWDLNPRYVAKNVWNILGQDPYAKTVIAKSGSSNIVVTTVGQDLKAQADGSNLKITVSNAPQTTTYVLISGVNSPVYGTVPPVMVDGKALNAVMDMSTSDSGYKYLVNSRQIIIKMNNSSQTTNIQVNF